MLTPSLDLGSVAVSNFVDSPGGALRAPLQLVLCEGCGLVQLSHTVERDILYRQNYWYQSGINESMVIALKDVVNAAAGMVSLKEGDTWLDIGANDGTLVGLVPEGVRTIGVEPSMEMSLLAYPRMRVGSTWYNTYFPLPAWADADVPPCKVITSIAMFYDLPDPNGFVAEIARMLDPEGVWVCQMGDLDSMLETNGFDAICHEHLEYWSPASFDALLARHGLMIAEMDQNRVNGGSLRFYVKHGKARLPQARVQWGDRLTAFAHRIEALREDTRAVLADLKRGGGSIWGYGASTKGNTLLQYYGLGTSTIEAIAERSEAKWGKYTVGSWIPIASEAEMRQARPDYLLVLPWHFIDGFLQREREFLEGGGRFIVPLPYLRTMGVEDADLYAKGVTTELRALLSA